MVDAQFADSLPNRFHISRMTEGETIQAGRNKARARSSLSRVRHFLNVSVCLISIIMSDSSL